MKIASFRNAGRAAALIGATALLSSHVVVEAAPAIAETALALPKEARGFNGMGVVSLVAAVVEFLKGSNAYDANVDNKCVLYMETTSGGKCQAQVACGNHASPDQMGIGYGGHSYNNWNVCYIGGRQFFTDPDLGDFSITFTEAGGINGNNEDGLHHPVIQLAGFNNWEPFKVADILQQQSDSRGHGVASAFGRGGGDVCKFLEVAGTKVKRWWCGLPKRNANSAFGMSLIDGESSIPGYTPGWCTAHVVQYQRNEFGTGANFAFDVVIHDYAGEQIGHIQHAAVGDDGGLSVSSRLPAMLTLHAGGNDQDFVSFAYMGQSWTCDDNDGGPHACTLGNGQNYGYENGGRNGDLGFTC